MPMEVFPMSMTLSDILSCRFICLAWKNHTSLFLFECTGLALIKGVTVAFLSRLMKDKMDCFPLKAYSTEAVSSQSLRLCFVLQDPACLDDSVQEEGAQKASKDGHMQQDSKLDFRPDLPPLPTKCAWNHCR